MRCTWVVPRAASPASTSEAEARRSEAMTGAPVSPATPRTTAVRPSREMRAPMRPSSGTCMKRFSKMVSLTTPVPLARHISAMIWACMSVGKPGKGSVVTLTPTSSVPRRQSTPPATSPIHTPISRSLEATASSSDSGQSSSSSSPSVIAAAHRNVPASMRSGMMRYSQPARRSTPSTRMRLVPWPLILAPQATRKLARSTTSGSRAALTSSVSPSARAAAMSRFSVPPTVGKSKGICAPRRRPWQVPRM